MEPGSDSPGLISDFAAKLLELLRTSHELTGGDRDNTFMIGCPAGWDAAARDRYLGIFTGIGVPGAALISESRAVMVGAIQSNAIRDHIDLRKRSGLVIDIGSSTTDLAYVAGGREQEIRTGGEVVLGGGIMDEIFMEESMRAASDPEGLRRVFSESSAWRVHAELTARHLKEQYFNRDDAGRVCEASCLISLDEDYILDLIMDSDMEERLTEKPCRQLSGRSFHTAFTDALRAVRDIIEPPDVVFLTGGVSRMRCVSDWCAEVFPEAILFRDREPEFSVARGLSWCGLVDHELTLFRAEVAALVASDTVERVVAGHLTELYRSAADELIDPILSEAVKPLLLEWRNGGILRLKDVEPILHERIDDYLHSEEAGRLLIDPVSRFMHAVSAELQRTTSHICRRYHLPEKSLEIASDLTPGDLELLGHIETGEMLPDKGFTGAALIVESVISVFVGMLCGGSGIVLVAEGPVGIIVGIVASAAVMTIGNVLGKDALQQRIMEAELPVAVRKLVLPGSLPKIVMPWRADDAGDDDIPGHRWKLIRARVRAHYDALLGDEDNEELRSLNDRMTGEITRQLESILMDMAERVEVPL